MQNNLGMKARYLPDTYRHGEVKIYSKDELKAINAKLLADADKKAAKNA